MLEQLLIELQNYPERMLASSKEQFRDYLIAKATQVGLPVEVFPQSKLAKNVVIGNLQKAKIIIGAHYDTAPRMFSWMMNHLVLFNIVLNVLMWVALPLIIIFMPFELALVVYLIFMFVFFGYMLGFFAIPNKHNINDNTSGVLTVLSLMHEIKSGDVAYVFFDNEEKGLIGSLVLAQYLRKLKLYKHFIILDCVGVGDTITFYHYQSKRFAESVQSSFTNLDHPRFNHEVKKGGYFATSDHLSFNRYANVGIMAMQRKNGRLVINNIHCEQDCYLDFENIIHVSQGIKKYLGDYYGIQ